MKKAKAAPDIPDEIMATMKDALNGIATAKLEPDPICLEEVREKFPRLKDQLK